MSKFIVLFILTSVTFSTSYSQNLPVFYVKAERLTTPDDGDKQKMLESLAIFQQVMNDKDFQRSLLDTTFLFDLPYDSMRTLTTKQIVDTLFSGKEWFRPYVDHTANINWECNQRKHKPPLTTTIGYGNESDSIFHTYIFYIRNNEISDIVNNLAHEWSHKIGFDHQKRNHPGRENTVPYLFGNLVERFVERYLK
jgi:hypothetical protein